MTTALLHPEDDSKVRVYVKGAPEYVVDKCTSYFTKDGAVEEADDSKRELWLDRTIIGWYAKSGLRTLALAYKDYDVD